LAEAHHKKYRTFCCGIIRLQRNRVESDGSSSSADERKKSKYNIKYNDLEQLLVQFNNAQDTLNKQLIEQEKLKKRIVDGEGNLQENLTQEEQLNQEVERLCKFVQENKQLLVENLTDKMDDMLISDNLKQKFAEADKDENIRQISNPVTKVLAIALRGLAQRNNQRQNNFADQMKEDTKFLQQQAFEKEAAKNDHRKGQWLADEEAKLQRQMSAHERESLENDLRGKLS